MSLKPICVKCQRFYRPKTNGIYFIEGMPKGKEAPPGNKYPELWQPYKIWLGDLWECQGCGHELISGVGTNPISERYHEYWEEARETIKIHMQVNDC
jgi:hypothetical protein